MRKGFLLTMMTGFILLSLSGSVRAQYFKFDNLSPEQINQGIPELEVKAILKMFGSVVGSGLYHTADLHSVAGFDVGIRGVVGSVPDEFQGLPIFTSDDRLGLAFLHASLGLPANLEAIGRFFYFPLGAEANDAPGFSDSRGGVTLIGGGLKYGLLQQFGIPKIMLMGTYHALLVPEEFDFGTVGTLSFNAVVSHSLPFLSVYAGVGVDITSLKVNDTVPIPDIAGQRFTEEGLIYRVGAKVTPLPLVFVNASLNFGEFNSFDLGMGLSLR